MLGADVVARVDDVERAEHIGADGLARVALQDRHVLVRGRVEDDLGAHVGEHRFDHRGVTDVGERHLRVAPERLDRVVEVGLVVIEEHESRR